LDPANSKFRSSATYKNPFPDTQKGNLDYDLLKLMGLNKARLEKHDAFFFWQLLFPICNPAKSGIPDNPRMPFYSNVEAWSQKYAAHMGIGGSYGHDYKQVMATEFLHFDMAVVQDGVLGGSCGAIYCRWSRGESNYSMETAGAITHTRWLQAKGCTNSATMTQHPKGVRRTMTLRTSMTTFTSVSYTT
jgi:hypothetical protein